MPWPLLSKRPKLESPSVNLKVLVEGSNTAIDLIAVHGLNVFNKLHHAEATWTGENGKIWLRDFLPRDVPYARVLLFEYNSNVAFQTSTVGLRSAADSLLSLLLGERENATKRPIIFIAHSLGGLVVKRALVTAKLEERYDSVFEATRGIAFFGTPHRGGNGASIGDVAAKIARSVLLNPENTFMTALKKNSLLSEELAADFRHQCDRLDILSFYETLPMKPLGLIVDAESAQLGYNSSLELQIPVAANHSRICKFSDRESPQYKLVSQNVVRLIKTVIIKGNEDTSSVRGSLPNQRRPSNLNRCILPFSRNGKFVGRKALLSNLEEVLEKPTEHYNRRVSLYGLGGTGKSQVAVEYAYMYQARNPKHLILWVHCSTEYNLRQSFLRIADKFEIPGRDSQGADLLRLTKDWLARNYEVPWLMILDNADDIEMMFGLTGTTVKTNEGKTRSEKFSSRMIQYIPDCDHGAILMTTRDKQVGVKFARGQHMIKIEPFTTAESNKFVSSLLDSDRSQTDEVNHLLHRLDYLPLALAQACAYMQENTMTVGKYLKLLEHPGNVDTLLSKEFETLGRSPDIPNAVFATWVLSFNQIKSRCPRAANILSLIAIYDRLAIPETLLLKKPPSDTSHPYFRNMIKLDDESESVDLDFEEACGILKAFSLINDTTVPGTYEIHPLLHLTIKHWLRTNSEMIRWAMEALRILTVSFPSRPRVDDWATCESYLPHALSLIDHLVNLKLQYQDAVLELVFDVSKYLWDRGQDISKLNQLSLQITKRLPHASIARTVRMQHRIASELLRNGRLKEAEETEFQTLRWSSNGHADFRAILSNWGRVDAEIHYSLYGLAEVWKEQGKLALAERLLKCLLEMLSEASSKRVETAIELADVFRLQKRFEDADHELQQAAGTVEDKRNAHALSLRLEKCAACVLRDQGRTAAAETRFSQLLVSQKSLLGSDHPEVLKSMEQIALLMKLQGRFEEALRMLEVCCAASEDVLGAENNLVNRRKLMLKRWQEDIEVEDETPFPSVITTPTTDERHRAEFFVRGLESEIEKEKAQRPRTTPHRMGFGLLEEDPLI